jgi:hypothetical protein
MISSGSKSLSGLESRCRSPCTRDRITPARPLEFDFDPDSDSEFHCNTSAYIGKGELRPCQSLPIAPPLRSSHFALPVRPPCFVTVTLLDTPVRSNLRKIRNPQSAIETPPLVSSKRKCAPPSPTPPPGRFQSHGKSANRSPQSRHPPLFRQNEYPHPRVLRTPVARSISAQPPSQLILAEKIPENPQSAVRNPQSRPPLFRQKFRAPALFLSSSRLQTRSPLATILRHRGSMD